MGSHKKAKGLIAALLLFACANAQAREEAYLRVREIDGAPNVNTVTTIRVPNDSLTDNVDGSVDLSFAAGSAPSSATFITQVAEAGLSAEQALSALTTGLLKNTTGTGVLSIAAEGTDYYAPGGTDVSIADGGTGASDAQSAINALTQVSGATNEYVLTKDTGTGNALWKAVTSSQWTESGGFLYNTTTTNDMGFGTSSAISGAKFSFDGNEDEIQAIIQGHSTQTSDIFVVEKSDGTDLLRVTNAAGVIISSGSGTQDLKIGDASTATATITSNLSGATDPTITIDNALHTFSHGVTVSGTTTLGTVAGAVDAGGATSVEIPNGTAPTVDAAGEVAVDTTDGQLVWYDGTAKRVASKTYGVSATIESITAADDNYAFWMAPQAVTITGVAANCRGTCTTTATFTLEDRGGNAMTITGTNPTVATTGDATFAAVTAGNTLNTGEMIAFDVTNTPTTGDTYNISLQYTINST